MTDHDTSERVTGTPPDPTRNAYAKHFPSQVDQSILAGMDPTTINYPPVGPDRGTPEQSITSRRSALPVGAADLDRDLLRTVRRTVRMRQGFYVVVLLVALAGQVSGAVEALHIAVAAAAPAVGALELGGVVILANADVRRRLGERATASRLLSAAIAAGAVAFNWLAHTNHLMGGFFAGMSALGYLVWLMHTENQRRDRLRAKGDLPPTTPAYEMVEHWLRHPWLTHRARALAKADPGLDLYTSLAAAKAAVSRERRHAAIAKVLHRKIRAAVDPTTADIAIAVYDLDQIAARLAHGADYDGLTALLARDLDPTRLAAEPGTGTGEPVPPLGEEITEALQSAAVPPPVPADTGTAVVSPPGTGRTAIGTGTDQDAGTGTTRPRPIVLATGTGTGTTRSRPTVVATGTGTGHVLRIRAAVPASPVPVPDEDGGTGKAAARSYWDREIAAGRTPTGADLTRAAGLSPKSGLGRRWARQWSAVDLAPDQITSVTDEQGGTAHAS